MKLPLLFFASAAGLLSVLTPSLPAQNSIIAYQGHLMVSGGTANGIYDFLFTMHDAAVGGTMVGSTNSITSVGVSNGLFSVALDFGGQAFDGAERWLEIGVRTNGQVSPPEWLRPRQPVNSTPYAIQAKNASTLNGLSPGAFAPVTGSTAYVARAGDTMTGPLLLPGNGLIAGSQQLVLSSGKVGIGMPPDAMLTLNSPDANNTAFKIRYAGAQSANVLEVRDVLDGLRWRADNNANLFLDSVNLQVGANTFFADHASGRVGIGTTTPEARLHVGGNVAISEGKSFIARYHNPNNDYSSSLAWNSLQLGNNGANYIIAGRTARGGSLIFATDNTTDYSSDSQPHNGKEVMTMTATGNIGIGTTTPTSSLEVVGNHASAPVAVFRQSNPANLGFVAIDSPTDDGSRPSHLLFRRAGVDKWSVGGFYPSDFFGIGTSQLQADQKFVVDTGGNVGVGTATPSVRFHVIGDQAYIQGTSGLAALDVNQGGTGAAALLRGGNVGIGTVSPVTELHVSGSGTGLPATSGVAQSPGHVARFQPGDNAVLDLGGNSSFGFWLQSTDQTGLSENYPLLLNPNGGNVGIGAPAPTARLEVAGTVKATSFVGDGSGLTGVDAVGPAGGDLTGTYPNPAIANNVINSAKLASDTASLSKISSGALVAFGGNVGVGRTPTSKLDVAGEVRATSFSGNGSALTGVSPSGFAGGDLSGTYPNPEIRSGAVGLTELANDAVNSSKLANDSASLSKLSGGVIQTSGGSIGIGGSPLGFRFYVNGSAGKPGGGEWSVASDERLKKNIQPLSGALAKLLALHGVRFEYKNPATIGELDGIQIGMIAQEVEKIFPEWVETGPDGYKRVTVRGLTALVVEALRELRAERDHEIDELKATIADLKTELRSLVESRSSPQR